MGSFCLKAKRPHEDIIDLVELRKLLQIEENELLNVIPKGTIYILFYFNYIESNEKNINEAAGKDYYLLIVKCALTELLYISHFYENEIMESNSEYDKFKKLFTSFYMAKETEWRDTVIELFCNKLKEYKEYRERTAKVRLARMNDEY